MTITQTQFNTLMHDEWHEFSKKINTLKHELGLSNATLECDHAAIRVNSIEQAEKLKLYFSQCGTIISENIINGRPILIIKLDNALNLNGTLVHCVELPFPSEKRYPNEGWEHVEFVIPGHAQTCEQLIFDSLSIYPSLADILKPNESISGSNSFTVKLSSPKGEHERIANPTIAIKNSECCIKLHPFSIQDIIASEAK